MAKNIIIIIEFIIILILSLIIFRNKTSSISQSWQGESDTKIRSSDTKTSENIYKNARITFELIESANYTWGYKILVEDNPIIIQLSKPGLPGNIGFKTKEKAIKVANLVIDKIRNGQIPPTVSIDELKFLDAL